MKLLKTFNLYIFIIFLSFNSFGENFTIESLRIGPNPLVQGIDSLYINYTSSIFHTAEYYFYSITGELVFYEKINPNVIEGACTSAYTTSGTCKFELKSMAEMASLPKQLYVMAFLFTSTAGNSIGDQISKKKYVIIK